MAISAHLQAKLELLPDKPGCYIMKDEKGNILYVGKAKVLKNRVRSYFHGVHNYKTTKLVMQIADFEFLVTGSEKEALLLEINLIKKHRPPFNIMFMDDKTYPYIEVTSDDNFTVRISRKVTNKKNQYFGPYPSGTAAYEIVKLLHSLFPIRKCKTIPGTPCLYYHMHKCLAPCIQEVSSEENQKIRKQVVDFLKGNCQPVLEDLQSRMEAYAQDLQFERAQEVLEMIQSIHHIQEKQTIDFQDRKDRDVFGWYEDKGYVAFQGLIIRDGKMLERSLSITPIYEDVQDAFVAFLGQYYEKNTVPKEILVPASTPVEILETMLGTKVKIPVKGEKKKLLDMAMANARTAHEQKFSLVYKKDKDLEMANQHLSRIFHKPIHTIEIFDNSHISGTHNVSGLVVFEDGKPATGKYRKYQLKEYRSDTDSMQEVITRRYGRLAREKGPMPDLLLVDGGIGQIHAAQKALDALGVSLTLAGLVKDDKHATRALLMADGSQADLNKEDPLFFLLTRIQDEVHRFAIAYHRQKRAKSMLHSILDDVPGIGPKRQEALRKAFGSVKAMKAASLQELEQVVPSAQAAALYARLHEKDPSAIVDDEVEH